MQKKTVVVGLSGGVDSSVAAYLLQKQGYRVIGVFMRNWVEQDATATCSAEQDYADVAKVADKLSIPYYSMDFSQEYKELVFSTFLEDLRKGRTPNPDVLCNQKIKFHVFWEKAGRKLGADYLATGHYCQPNEEGALLKGVDKEKDQSYFLHTVSSKILRKTLFPIGHLPKAEVREIARKLELPVHNKRDSTGICFIGKRDFRSFVGSFLGYQPGNFVDSKGNVLGRHVGAAFYTIGQRKGLGIGGSGAPWFVASKNLATNEVLLVQGENHPALFRAFLQADELFWVQNPPPIPSSLHAKIRYRQKEAPCTILEQQGTILSIQFAEPQRAVTPGQSVVFYETNRCLGGGKIL